MLFLSLLTSAFAWSGYQAEFQNTIQRVEQMVWDSNMQAMVQRHGLSLVNVTWEDTGRSKNSV